MGVCFFILREMYKKAGLYSFDACLTLLWFGALQGVTKHLSVHAAELLGARTDIPWL